MSTCLSAHCSCSCTCESHSQQCCRRPLQEVPELNQWGSQAPPAECLLSSLLGRSPRSLPGLWSIIFPSRWSWSDLRRSLFLPEFLGFAFLLPVWLSTRPQRTMASVNEPGHQLPAPTCYSSSSQMPAGAQTTLESVLPLAAALGLLTSLPPGPTFTTWHWLQTTAGSSQGRVIKSPVCRDPSQLGRLS